MSSFFCPQSLVFVRISPSALTNVYDSRLITHTSNLAFSSQLNTKGNGGFFSKVDYGNYSLSGEIFNSIFLLEKIQLTPVIILFLLLKNLMLNKSYLQIHNSLLVYYMMVLQRLMVPLLHLGGIHLVMLGV